MRSVLPAKCISDRFMLPLRDRIEDIPLLMAHFINKLARSTGKKVTTISQKALQALNAYAWPGNIRELENLIERSLLLATGNVIKEILLPDPGRIILVNGQKDACCKTIDENERDYIISVLKKYNGKISGEGGAAEILGIPSSTLHSKIKKLGIKKEQPFNK